MSFGENVVLKKILERIVFKYLLEIDNYSKNIEDISNNREREIKSYVKNILNKISKNIYDDFERELNYFFMEKYFDRGGFDYSACGLDFFYEKFNDLEAEILHYFSKDIYDNQEDSIFFKNMNTILNRSFKDMYIDWDFDANIIMCENDYVLIEDFLLVDKFLLNNYKYSDVLKKMKIVFEEYNKEVDEYYNPSKVLKKSFKNFLRFIPTISKIKEIDIYIEPNNGCFGLVKNSKGNILNLLFCNDFEVLFSIINENDGLVSFSGKVNFDASKNNSYFFEKIMMLLEC